MLLVLLQSATFHTTTGDAGTAQLAALLPSLE
jgi:hypothetical protein